MTTYRLPQAVIDSLPSLIHDLDTAKRDAAALNQHIRDLTDLIATIQRTTAKGAAKPEPTMLILAGQFEKMSVPEAMRTVMMGDPSLEYRVGELSELLYRGSVSGGAPLSKIQTNVAAAMQYWRGRDRQWLQPGKGRHAWRLSPAGLAHFSSSETLQPSGLFQNVGRG